eukprot:CAMPEP_0183791858 /NCGR_PEP_ID=MMETSP0803_2-20130417/2158_1 /TAXON_ID=195967 /ORGANISM="Crustomastix stigmata, Strain CCMP3273" /LENGTH=269 /DNA_ID=CAMNT_0026036191 /DNA_START=1349 /DNA_END=2158 /DNA_ORIENTATION=+
MAALAWDMVKRQTPSDKSHPVIKEFGSHLLSLYVPLKAWGCDENICVAGMLHSIFSTKTAPNVALYSFYERGIMEQVTNQTVMDYVSLYCLIDQIHFITCVLPYMHKQHMYAIKLRGGHFTNVSLHFVKTYLLISIANGISLFQVGTKYYYLMVKKASELMELPSILLEYLDMENKQDQVFSLLSDMASKPNEDKHRISVKEFYTLGCISTIEVAFFTQYGKHLRSEIHTLDSVCRWGALFTCDQCPGATRLSKISNEKGSSKGSSILV